MIVFYQNVFSSTSNLCGTLLGTFNKTNFVFPPRVNSSTPRSPYCWPLRTSRNISCWGPHLVCFCCHLTIPPENNGVVHYRDFDNTEDNDIIDDDH